MKIIENKTFPQERDLYNQHNLHLINCVFKGIEDGESALKECGDIILDNCLMDLRYPLWHNENLTLNRVKQTENCRAAIWYSKHILINDSILNGIKAIRECTDIKINNTKIISPEFGWKSNDFEINNCILESQYNFFLAKNIKANNTIINGKYGLQYIENSEFNHCDFNTKDAFWHGKNIIVRDSVIKGEYLAWYSENLTFINCEIIGIQPFCYCQNLTLINCTMKEANFAFEYSSVKADIHAHVDSIKNPLKGIIKVDSLGELLLTSDSLYPCNAQIFVSNKRIK